MLNFSIISEYLVNKYNIDKRYNLAKRIKDALNENRSYVFVDGCFIVLGFKEITAIEFMNDLNQRQLKNIQDIDSYVYLNLSEYRLKKLDLRVSLNQRQLFYHSKKVEQKKIEELYIEINALKGYILIRANRFLTYLKPYLKYIDETYVDHRIVSERLRKILSKRNKTLIIDAVDYLLTLEQDAVVLGLLAKIMYLHWQSEMIVDKLTHLSVEKNNAFIQYELAANYLSKNKYEEAMFWFERSASNGYLKAVVEIEKISVKLNEYNVRTKSNY